MKVVLETGQSHGISLCMNDMVVYANLIRKSFAIDRGGIKVVLGSEITVYRNNVTIKIFNKIYDDSRLAYMVNTMSRLSVYKYTKNRYQAVWNVMLELVSDKFWNWILSSIHYLSDEAT